MNADAKTARHGDSIAPPVVWTLLHPRGLGARSFSLCLRSFTFSTQSDQKSFIDGNRFLAPVDFPLGYINPRISANALAEPHLAGFERLKAFSTFS